MNDPNRFEGRITEAKFNNFSEDCVKNRKAKDIKGAYICYIFYYRLTPTPLSLFSADGVMVNTKKALLN